MPRLFLCTLCDDVRFEVGGKHTLIGLFDTFNVADFAQALPRFRLFARIGLEQPGAHPLTLRITDAEGAFHQELTGTLEARTPSEVSGLHDTVFTATIAHLHVPRPGRYLFELSIDGTTLGGCAAIVHDAHAKPMQ